MFSSQKKSLSPIETALFINPQALVFTLLSLAKDSVDNPSLAS